ncbi:MAG TPA: Hsp20 family protein [Flavobacteriales bacterium]|nr:Hsp20 family protein [Flavobacteriales bacterium]HIK67704.1 Hsp20 family protein [Flavobacteriales bacterium]
MNNAFAFPHSRFIGFDHVWSEIEKLSSIANEKGFPRHNVVRHSDTEFSIELALAGYREEDLSIELKPGLLVVSGGNDSDKEREFLHKGITAKKFVESFRLAENVVVKGASFVNGLLIIDLVVEIPEEMRPRKININPNGGKNSELLTE